MMADLQALMGEAVSRMGYEVVDLEISNRGKLLRLFIDKPGGVNIDDCAVVSEHISHLLAVEHDIDYDRLEVSSPGLDRVLKKEADFERFAGSRVNLKVRIPLDGRKNFSGKLLGIEQGMVKIDCEGIELAIERTNIDKARLVPEF
jgi:ribosome maturation factor RimP